MATKTWAQSSGNLASTDANWSPAAKPTTGDDVVFANSAANCTWDITGADWQSSLSIASLTLTATYSGIVDKTGINITITGSIVIAGGSIESTQSGWLHVGTNVTMINTGFSTYNVGVIFYGSKLHTWTVTGGAAGVSGCCVLDDADLNVICTGQNFGCNGAIGGLQSFGTAGRIYIDAAEFRLLIGGTTSIGYARVFETNGICRWWPSNGNAIALTDVTVYAASHDLSNPGWGSASSVTLGANLTLYGNLTIDAYNASLTDKTALNTSGKSLIVHGSLTLQNTLGGTFVTHTFSGFTSCGALVVNSANTVINFSGPVRYATYTVTAGTVNITGVVDRQPFSSAKGGDKLPFGG